MNYPRISVIVPVYNVASYLRKCINSLLGQTYSNLEVILIDDGSTDGSEGICDEYAEQYSNIRVFHQENSGQAAARNLGIEIATGEWIGFLDSDDWVEKNMYEMLYNLAQTNNADLASCATRMLDVNGKVLSPPGSGMVYSLTPDEMIAGLVTNEIVRYEIWNKLWKRSLIGDIRFIKGQLCEEVHFDRLLFLRVNKMVHIDLQLHNYLVMRPGSTASAFRPERLCIFDELDSLIQDLEEKTKVDLADKVRWIASTFAYSIYNEAVDTGQSAETKSKLLKWFHQYYKRGIKAGGPTRSFLKMQLFNFSPELVLILRKVKKILM